jgi:hypothetical protein
MKSSDSIAKLSTALSAFQAVVENPPNTAENPFFKSHYAPLNDILKRYRPELAKQGLSIIQSASGDGETVAISTRLMHNSGEWIETEPLVLRPDKLTPQGAGSAITYGRRYAISAVLGISSEDDDDGNIAEAKEKGAAKKPAKPKGTREKLLAKVWITAKEAFADYDDEEIKRILHEYIADEFELESSKDLDIRQLETTLEWLEDWKQPPGPSEASDPAASSGSTPDSPTTQPNSGRSPKGAKK